MQIAPRRPAPTVVQVAEYNKAMKQALLAISLRHEFFASPGMAMQFVPSDEIETAATNGHMVLVNVLYFLGLNLEERIGLIAHENLHVGLGHPWRMGNRGSQGWNVSTDIGINEYLKQANLTLPQGALYADSVIPMLVRAGCPRPKADSLRTASAETIYDILSEYLASDGEGEGGKGGKKGKMPKPGPGEVQKAPSGDNAQEKISENVERLAAAAERVERMEQERKVSRSSIPAGLREWLKVAQKSVVDWKSMMWKYVQGSVPDDFSYRRTNRRYVDDGLFMPVQNRQGVGPIAVFVDSSGSVPDKHLAVFMSEITAIVDAVRPESVIVIPCDCDVHEENIVQLTAGEHYTPPARIQRGGTSFKPPFEYLAKHDILVDKIIYLTDMEGDFPNDPGIPTLWVSTIRENDKAPFGDVVVVDIV